MSPLAPDAAAREKLRQKAFAEQDAREKRDRALIDVYVKYDAKLKRLESERKRKMGEVYNRWREERARIDEEYL